MARKDSQTHTQEYLPEIKKDEINIEPTPTGSVMNSGEMTSPNFRIDRSGWRLNSDGSFDATEGNFAGTITANVLNIGGGKQVTVEVGDSIQDAITEVAAAGGGKVLISNGTHSVSSNIYVPSNTYIQGQNSESTIVDFGLNAAGFVCVGTGAYDTGTVALTHGSTTVTGALTVWTDSMIGQSILLGGLWYPIVNRVSNTEVTIALPYAGSDAANVTYVIANVAQDIKFSDMTIINSGSAAIYIEYVNETWLSDLNIQTSGVAVQIENTSNYNCQELDMIYCAYGLILNNSHFGIVKGSGSIITLTGAGFTFMGCSSASLTSNFAVSSATSGYYFYGSYDSTAVGCNALENTDYGWELAALNEGIILSNCGASANGSDGVKLTATSDICSISNSVIKDNGGYGVNIAAATCDNNTILAPSFDSNASGNINDAGTNTKIITATDPVIFGGSGIDGALTISSGTTTIDLGGNMFVTKNYSSISITGTGKLAFSNPHANGTVVFLKSSGNVTLTSSETPMLDLRGVGADVATDGITFWSSAPTKGANASGASAGSGGTQATAYFNNYNYYAGINAFTTGSGSGTGGTGGTATGGAGGAGKRGGGAMILECAGSFNFTTTNGISVAGQNGDNGANGGVTPGAGGGGGGGGSAGGSFVAIYKTLTANSGSVVVTGGTGGTRGTGTTGATGTGGGGGGGGASHIGAGSNGGNGSTGTSGGRAGNGGNGAAGSYFIGLKTS